MAALSPSPDSPPSGVPPSPTITPPPASSTPGGPPPPSSTSPPPTETPPTPSATPPSSNLSPPSAQPPSNSGSPPITPPPPSPVVSSPPPETPNAPPPAPIVLPPVTPTTPSTPPPIASRPPSPSFSPPPPHGEPPSSPPPKNAPPPSPPIGEPPSPPSSPPPSSPPPSSSPPSSPNSPPPTISSPPPPGPPPTSTPPPSPPKSESPPPPPPPSKTPKSPPSPPPLAQPPRGVPSQPPPPSSPGPPSRPNAPPKDSPRPAVEIPPPSTFTPPGPSKTVPVPPRSSDESAPGNNGNHGLSKKEVIAIGVVSGIILLGLIGLIAFWMLKRKKRSSGANNGHIIPASTGSSPRSDNLLVKSDSNFGGGSDTDHGGFGHSRSWFTYQDLSEATGGFSDENLLGEGGFGCVYKGQLVDGRVVAVKQLKIGGGQGEREFKAEVEIISRIHHRHLVSLVGYCIWESKRLLVYDYVPKNTLHFHLHGEGAPVLDWATRVKIAVGAARGITYLHEDCHPRIIHRDIKSSNILIDNNYEAQVSDFGLAKLAMDADTHVSTRVMGTFGYMAPEYATSGKLTDKSDVFSFGVVLLELVTGRKPVDSSQPLGDESLVQWARPLLKHALDTEEFDGLVDARLGKNYIESEMYRMIEAAAACVRHSSSKRPKMGQIVRALGVTDTGDLTNGLKVGESQLYTSAQQSADIRWFRRMAFGGSPNSSSDAFSQSTTQNSGYSTNSRQDMYFSAQPVQGGTSGQFSQVVQNRNFSGQREINVDILDERLPDANISRQPDQKVDTFFSAQGGISGQFTQASQNRSFSGEQHEINVDILDDHSPGDNTSRQQNQNPHHSTDQASQNV